MNAQFYYSFAALQVRHGIPRNFKSHLFLFIRCFVLVHIYFELHACFYHLFQAINYCFLSVVCYSSFFCCPWFGSYPLLCSLLVSLWEHVSTVGRTRINWEFSEEEADCRLFVIWFTGCLLFREHRHIPAVSACFCHMFAVCFCMFSCFVFLLLICFCLFFLLFLKMLSQERGPSKPETPNDCISVSCTSARVFVGASGNLVLDWNVLASRFAFSFGPNTHLSAFVVNCGTLQCFDFLFHNSLLNRNHSLLATRSDNVEVGPLEANMTIVLLLQEYGFLWVFCQLEQLDVANILSWHSWNLHTNPQATTCRQPHLSICQIVVPNVINDNALNLQEYGYFHVSIFLVDNNALNLQEYGYVMVHFFWK